MSALIATSATREHPGPLTDEELARHIAGQIPANSFVNLGIGRPTLIADYLDDDAGVILHTENGMLGMGPRASKNTDFELVNASKIPVTELPGASYFDTAESFALMRGGHLDVCVLGAFQVSADGDLANWSTGQPGAIPAVGGAMDLAVGAKSTYVMMSLFTKDDVPKLVPHCTYPLTAARCVSRIYTDCASFEIKQDGIYVLDMWGMSLDDLARKLGFPLIYVDQVSG